MLASSVATATQLLCIHCTISTSKLVVLPPQGTMKVVLCSKTSLLLAAQLLQHGLNKNYKPCRKYDSRKQSLNRRDTAVGQPARPKSTTSKPLWSYYSKNKSTPFNQLDLYITYIRIYICMLQVPHCSSISYCSSMVREEKIIPLSSPLPWQ